MQCLADDVALFLSDDEILEMASMKKDECESLIMKNEMKSVA